MIGSAIGGGKNLLFGSFVVKAGKTILVSTPATWPKPDSSDILEIGPLDESDP